MVYKCVQIMNLVRAWSENSSTGNQVFRIKNFSRRILKNFKKIDKTWKQKFSDFEMVKMHIGGGYQNLLPYFFFWKIFKKIHFTIVFKAIANSLFSSSLAINSSFVISEFVFRTYSKILSILSIDLSILSLVYVCQPI